MRQAYDTVAAGGTLAYIVRRRISRTIAEPGLSDGNAHQAQTTVHSRSQSIALIAIALIA